MKILEIEITKPLKRQWRKDCDKDGIALPNAKWHRINMKSYIEKILGVKIKFSIKQ